MAKQTLAVIGGDGIGPEVTAEALKVLEAVAGADTFHKVHFDLGERRTGCAPERSFPTRSWRSSELLTPFS